MADVIYAIVEGDGEYKAVPALIRRILHDQLYNYDYDIKALNAKGRGNLTVDGGLERFLDLTRLYKDCRGVVIVIDAEKDDQNCPVTLANSLSKRAASLGLPFPVAVVVAVCEYESWFLDNLDTIAPKFLASDPLEYPGDPERECSAKGWLNRHMPHGTRYKETQDQAKMTFQIDLKRTAHNLRSFRRMVHAIEQLVQAISNGSKTVTP